jgi:hypothetical protein
MQGVAGAPGDIVAGENGGKVVGGTGVVGTKVVQLLMKLMYMAYKLVVKVVPLPVGKL